MKEHGGMPATYDEVMNATFEDLYADTLMIKKKSNDENEKAGTVLYLIDILMVIFKR
jgi:hypothetical protein